jgi:hypothetical protein
VAVFEDVVEGLGGSIATLATGIGVLVLAPTLLPHVARAIKPLAVAALQSGIVGYRRIGEATGALHAEARADIEAQRRQRHPGRPAGGGA